MRVFEQLQRYLRPEEEWVAFAKLFKIYMDGIISVKDFFTLFDHKFGAKLKFTPLR